MWKLIPCQSLLPSGGGGSALQHLKELDVILSVGELLQLGGHVGEVGDPQLQARNLPAEPLHVGTFLRQDDLVHLVASLPQRHQHLIEDLLAGTRHSSCGVLSREER